MSGEFWATPALDREPSLESKSKFKQGARNYQVARNPEQLRVIYRGDQLSRDRCGPLPNNMHREFVVLVVEKENMLFNPRCPYAESICTRENPPLREISSDHFVACHFAEKIA